MITLLLAGSLAASVPVVLDRMQLDDDVAILTKRIMVLEEKATQEKSLRERDERIAVDTWKCFNRNLFGTGADIWSTGMGLFLRPDDLTEGNKGGPNAEARLGLKLAQMSAVGSACYVLNKDDHGKSAKIVSWGSVGFQVAMSIRNWILTAQKKPIKK